MHLHSVGFWAHPKQQPQRLHLPRAVLVDQQPRAAIRIHAPTTLPGRGVCDHTGVDGPLRLHWLHRTASRPHVSTSIGVVSVQYRV
jgi:hypothetical protein